MAEHAKVAARRKRIKIRISIVEARLRVMRGWEHDVLHAIAWMNEASASSPKGRRL